MFFLREENNYRVYTTYIILLLLLQEKELKGFKDKQKQDRKLVQQEFDMLAKTAKKEDVRKKKEQKEFQLQEEVCFVFCLESWWQESYLSHYKCLLFPV